MVYWLMLFYWFCVLCLVVRFTGLGCVSTFISQLKIVMFLFLTTYSLFYLKFFVGTVGPLITRNLLRLEVWSENDLVVETHFL